MTNSVRLALDLEFADGVTRTVRPLTIKRLRKFLKAADKLNTENPGKMSDKDVDAMMDAAAIIVDGFDPALAANRASLEDAVDLEIFWKMMTVAMGNKVSDPNE